MSLKSRFCVIILSFLIVYIYLLNYSETNLKNLAFENNEELLQAKNKYIKNRYYFDNNNVVQYSSYIIKDKDQHYNSIYKIEAIIELSYIYVTDFGSKENFKCIVKSFKNKTNIEIVELEAIDSAEINLYKENKKLVFNLKLEDFKSYLKNPNNFDLNYLAIAVVWKFDFDKSLERTTFENILDKNKQKHVMPYSLIRFQIPDIIESQIQRLPSVSICAAYLYGIHPPQLLNWIEFNLAFGISEIMLYDGTIKKDMLRVILFIFFIITFSF